MAHHHASVAVPERTDESPLPGTDGRAPGGMWALAWRQHRAQVLTALGLLAAYAIAAVIFRTTLLAVLADNGCEVAAPADPCTTSQWGTGLTLWYNHPIHLFWQVLTYSTILGPAVLAMFTAAPIFPREFEQGTQVFALTQAVSPRRWWAVKITVALAPVVAGLTAWGFILRWATAGFPVITADPMARLNLPVFAILPAALFLACAALGVTIGIAVRHTTPALALTLAASIAFLIVVGENSANLLPSQRAMTPISDAVLWVSSTDSERPVGPLADDPEAHRTGFGYLDADGREIGTSAALFDRINDCDLHAFQEVTARYGDAYYEDPAIADEVNNLLMDVYEPCMANAGITATYTDYLPGSMLWPLRLVVTALCAAIAGLALAAGRWRLRASIGKR